jgi:uncharacterized damage-inducible protein DinB
MVEQPSVLATFYAGWENYERLLIQAIAPLTPAQLALGAAPHLLPIGVLAAHIIAARVYWIDGMLGEGNPDIAPLVHWDDAGEPARSAAELVGGLEASWRLVQGALARWTTEDLSRLVQVVRNGRERNFTRQWVIWHLLEHDLHHGGELAFSLGIHHLAAPEL